MKISNLGEFGLIEEVIAPEFKELIRKNTTGIGDDCSIMPVSKKVSHIFTTDMLIEKTHFLRDKITPYQLGFKSLAVNLSDIAAMGGSATASYLSIGLPENIEVDWMEEFIKGFKTLSKEENVPLMGGDTTSCEDKIIVNVGVTGEIKNENIKLRSAAKEGDLVCLTGKVGDSAGGLQILLNDLKTNDSGLKLLEQHLSPYPHMSEGKWLSDFESVHAMIDVSDGISSDLGHICKASGVQCSVEIENVPISGELKKLTEEQNWNPYELALSGGEDYVLLLTIDKENFKSISEDFRKKFDKTLYAIGSVQKGKPGIIYTHKGKKIEGLKKGYTHF